MPLEFAGVSELAKTFGVLPAEIKAALKPAVLDAANLIGDQAKVDGSFSSWIPGAVSVSAHESHIPKAAGRTARTGARET